MKSLNGIQAVVIGGAILWQAELPFGGNATQHIYDK